MIENTGKVYHFRHPKVDLVLILYMCEHNRSIKENTFTVFLVSKSKQNERQKMAIIGYIRVSSNRQTLEHQEFEIKKFAREQKIKIDKWVEEKISSRKALNKRKHFNCL